MVACTDPMATRATRSPRRWRRAALATAPAATRAAVSRAEARSSTSRASTNRTSACRPDRRDPVGVGERAGGAARGRGHLLGPLALPLRLPISMAMGDRGWAVADAADDRDVVCSKRMRVHGQAEPTAPELGLISSTVTGSPTGCPRDHDEAGRATRRRSGNGASDQSTGRPAATRSPYAPARPAGVAGRGGRSGVERGGDDVGRRQHDHQRSEGEERAERDGRVATAMAHRAMPAIEPITKPTSMAHSTSRRS